MSLGSATREREDMTVSEVRRFEISFWKLATAAKRGDLIPGLVAP